MRDRSTQLSPQSLELLGIWMGTLGTVRTQPSEEALLKFVCGLSTPEESSSIIDSLVESWQLRERLIGIHREVERAKVEPVFNSVSRAGVQLRKLMTSILAEPPNVDEVVKNQRAKWLPNLSAKSLMESLISELSLGRRILQPALVRSKPQVAILVQNATHSFGRLDFDEILPGSSTVRARATLAQKAPKDWLTARLEYANGLPIASASRDESVLEFECVVSELLQEAILSGPSSFQIRIGASDPWIVPVRQLTADLEGADAALLELTKTPRVDNGKLILNLTVPKFVSTRFPDGEFQLLAQLGKAQMLLGQWPVSIWVDGSCEIKADFDFDFESEAGPNTLDWLPSLLRVRIQHARSPQD